MAAKETSLKLLIDKEKNRVLFAESDNDFVDILFSFLTMPLGTIVRLAGKQSKIGCIDHLYKSVEDLDLKLLQTEACKSMLLHPKSASEEQCKDLVVKIDDTTPTKYYICSSWKGCTENHHLVTTVKNAPCRCGKAMNWKVIKKKKVVEDGKDDGGVFVKGKMRYMISDDLHVSLISSITSFTLLKELGVSDFSVLEERNVNVGAPEVLHLLKRLLLSKTPLTDVFLGEHDKFDGEELDLKIKDLDIKDIAPDSKGMAQSQRGRDIDSDPKKISVKLLFSKSNKKVLYAESGEEFPDLLFSFLAFPLGSIIKCLGGCTSMVCLDNLYKSVEDLNSEDCIKSEECKAMLIDPKLAPYFGCMNQLLQIEEQGLRPHLLRCIGCSGLIAFIIDNGPWTCSHGRKSIQLSTMNRKFPDVVTELGGAFMAEPGMFMVTDDLVVTQFSPISGISLLSKFNISISDIEERVVSMGEEEAMSLLKASLISKSVLSDAFYFKKPKQMGRGSHKRYDKA